MELLFPAEFQLNPHKNEDMFSQRGPKHQKEKNYSSVPISSQQAGPDKTPSPLTWCVSTKSAAIPVKKKKKENYINQPMNVIFFLDCAAKKAILL